MVNLEKKHKFIPGDFEGMLGLPDDLYDFYKAYDVYNSDKNLFNEVELISAWEKLFFTIKHREIDSGLNPAIANEMRRYLEDVLYAH